MAGQDNILNLFITANIDSLKTGMDAAVSSFKGGVDAMKGAVQALPDTVEASVLSAAASFAALNPQLQAQGATVLDLKIAYDNVRTAIAETEAVVAEAGGTLNVEKSILEKYNEETTREIVLRRAVKDAVADYDRAIKDLINSQLLQAEAANTATAATNKSTQAGVTAEITDEARARVKAKLAELEAADSAAASANASTQVKAATDIAAATESTAVAANTASEAYIRLARATITNAQAQAEVRSLTQSASEYVGLEAQFTDSLALAQERAAATSAELAAAQKSLTAATEQASAAQNTFRARVIASEFGMRAFISSTITSVPVLVGVLVASFAVRAVEAIQKTELELQNLAILSGSTVRDLYAMGQAAEAFGAKSDDLTGAFRRLDKTISDAASGNESARQTLRELGVDMTEINAGIVPKTNVVLAQMADYLHLNAGNAEVMRAAMRALGSDSVALGAFLSQGSQEVRKQSEQFTATGRAMQDAAADARKLQEEIAKLTDHWNFLKLKIVEATNATIDWFKGGIDYKLIAFDIRLLGDAWSYVKTIINGTAQAEKDMIAEMKKIPALAPPPPPQFATLKTEKEKKPPLEKSDLPEFREELARQEALFDGSRSEMLAMELAFWERLISTGRVKSRDLIAVHAEIARTEIQLRRQVVEEAESASREDVALTRAGSQDRIDEALRNMNLERQLHKEGSVQFNAAEKEYLQAVRDRVEETIRLQITAMDEQVALEGRGSAARVTLYNGELDSLRSSFASVQAMAQAAQLDWTRTGNEQAHQRMLIFNGEAEFILNEIAKVTKAANTASRERTAQLEKERADAERLKAQQAFTDAREKVGVADVTASKDIQQIEQNGLITFRTKVDLIRQVIDIQRAQIDDALSGAEAEAAINLALAKTTEEKIAAERLLLEVQKERSRESKRLLGEELDLDNRISKQQEANALRVGGVISSSFTKAFDTMLTTHTNFATVMTKFWNDMVVGFARMALQILADWIKMIAARVVAWALGETQETAASETGAAARNTVGLAATLKSIGRAAAKAAANVYAWVQEEIPPPAGPIIGAVLAAGAFATVLAFGALASAREGALLTKDTLVAAHSGELVIPAEQTQQLLGAFPSSRLPGAVASGLTGLADTAKIGNSILGAASSLPGAASSATSGASVSSRVDNRTIHVRPSITVNQHGGSGGRMSTDEISMAVNMGIRRGLVKMPS